MLSQSKKIIFILYLIAIFSLFLNGLAASQAASVGDQLIGGAKNAGQTAGYTDPSGNAPDFATAIIKFINVLLTLVGIIFLLLMLYAGYTWMMAKGDEEEIKKAKQTIKAAIIGIIIIFVSRIVTEFALTQLGQATATSN